MNSSFEHILSAAMGLSDTERAQLVDALMGTLAPEDAAPLQDAWLTEIADRSQTYDRGEVQAVPWEEVKARVRRRT